MRVTLLMKWKALQRAIEDPALTPCQKLAFARLLMFHNAHTGYCHPSVDRLAIAIGYTSRNMRAGLRKLQANGYISGVRKSAVSPTNQYDLNFVGGKMAPKHAEKMNTKGRNLISAKEKKEEEKEYRSDAGSYLVKSRKKSTEKQTTKTHEQIEKRFVSHHQSVAEGYEAMLSIPDDVREEIVQAYLTGSVSLNAAVQKLLEATGCSN